MMANGKTPQNFPNTKGEFDHLTSEWVALSAVLGTDDC